ncbi:type I-E CRISPR-associated protein Cas6/Cse3/CasE [Streptomyces sp. NPDC060205]|uniref:type I-E CRISPR-associated protein Cas6/Cse3/CasE n=1 Tax=Streptomyces sp. NPDC060205 TaxID=3347072 RepID=UPI00364831E2
MSRFLRSSRYGTLKKRRTPETRGSVGTQWPTLTVTDPAALVDAMTQGVGYARAYGCGLLLAG